MAFSSLCGICSSGVECWMDVRGSISGFLSLPLLVWNVHPMRWDMYDWAPVSSAESCLRQSSHLTSGDWMEESTVSLSAELCQNIASVMGSCKHLEECFLSFRKDHLLFYSKQNPMEEESNPVFLALPVQVEPLSCQLERRRKGWVLVQMSQILAVLTKFQQLFLNEYFFAYYKNHTAISKDFKKTFQRL